MRTEQSSYQAVKLSTLVGINIGKTPARKENSYWKGSNTWVSISDMKGDRFIASSKECISDEGVKQSGIKIVQKDTLLFSFKLSIGKVAITEKALFTNEAIASFPILDTSIVDQVYLFYVLKEFNFTDGGDRAVMGKTLNKAKLKELKIPLPPLAEQKKIASILDAADRLRQKDAQLIAKYNELSQSLFLDMFGDPVTNPMGWKRRCFLDIFETTTGKLDSNASSQAGRYPFFTCAKEALMIDSYSYDQEALLLAGNNAAGIFDVKYYKGKFDAYQRTYILCLKDTDADYSFMQIALEKKLEDLQRLSIGSSTKYLTMKILGRLEFTVPPLTLQNQFAERIQHIEAQKQQAQAALQKSDDLFHSLLQRAFKGELTRGDD